MPHPNPGLEALQHFASEDFEFFASFDEAVDGAVRSASRKLPADFYDELRTGILRLLLTVAGGTRVRVKLVVDTNILLMDAFRVGKGIPSTTGRLFESHFVELVAPSEIAAEARTHLMADLPKGASLDGARSHLEMLLSRLSILTGTSAESYRRSVARIAGRDRKDVPFLAVLIDTGSEGVISRDKKAFDSLEGVKRWDLGDVSELVYTYESGTLSLLIGAMATDALIKLASTLLEVVAAAIFEALQVISGIIVGLAEGTVDTLSRVPSWAWVAIGVGLLVVIIAAIVHEGFRDWLADGISKAGEFLRTVGRAVVDAFTVLAKAVRDLLAWIWSLVAPAVVVTGKLSLVAFGALFRRVMLLLDECQRAISNQPT